MRDGQRGGGGRADGGGRAVKEGGVGAVMPSQDGVVKGVRAMRAMGCRPCDIRYTAMIALILALLLKKNVDDGRNDLPHIVDTQGGGGGGKGGASSVISVTTMTK